MKLVLTDEARADLFEIGDWVAQQGLRRGVAFVDKVKARCRQMTAKPKSGPLVRRFDDRGVRRILHGDCLIFYRVLGDTVEVIHLLHGARDYDPLLFPKA